MKQAFSLRYELVPITQGVALGWYDSGLQPALLRLPRLHIEGHGTLVSRAALRRRVLRSFYFEETRFQ